MRLLRDLSFRYKIPLRGGLLVAITAMILTGVLMAREYRDMKLDLATTSASLGRVLAKTLVTPLTHDDVWRAYEIINSPFATSGNANPNVADLVVVLDRRNQVYVATDPAQYPMLTDPGRANPDFNRLQEVLAAYQEFETRSVEPDGSDRIYVVTPIVADGVLLGTLVMAYSKSAFLPRFLGTARSGALVALMVVALIIPASWFWAQRFARPLVDLADTMGQVKTSIPDESEIRIEESGDEIGRVVVAFKSMLRGLREKEALEREMVLSERLAAIGRLSAAIAHEINNPLGGMLNALNTFKRHGNDDPLTVRTLSLIERGLVQVKDTVSALLVEVKQHSHDLTRQDVEDVRTLVQPDTQRKHVAFAWTNAVPNVLPLPATPVRQILINLLLNAEQAVGEGGRIDCSVLAEDRQLRVVVSNDGDFIPLERMEVLFEPLSTSRATGHGLGLWITYQLVRQLGGDIVAESEPGETRFSVVLPFQGSVA